MIPLFAKYPSLKERLPYVSLGEFPTPIAHLSKLGREIGADHLYLKHDGLSGSLYGGNKIRKLEFILADVLQKKAKQVFTFGFAGSNHSLATAVYAHKMKFKCISMLLSQPNAQYVRRNLLYSHVCGAELHHYKNEMTMYMPALIRLFGHFLKHGKLPYIILPGGSSPIGAVGYVNAALELKEQIATGLLPEPDQVFVPLGTTGTAVGLMLGLRAAGLKTHVVSVRVVDEKFGNKEKFIKLFRKTLELIRSIDSTFPHMKIADDEIDIEHNFFGEQYAGFTEQGMTAVNLVTKSEGIKLDGTYTGKAMAALIDRVRNHSLRNQVILFWNTYNARDFSGNIKGVDYHLLPRRFHRYFEEEVQPLDKHR